MPHALRAPNKGHDLQGDDQVSEWRLMPIGLRYNDLEAGSVHYHHLMTSWATPAAGIPTALDVPERAADTIVQRVTNVPA